MLTTSLRTSARECAHLRRTGGWPVILSFGATWCPDCRREVSILQKLRERHPQLVILSVDSREDTDTVRAPTLRKEQNMSKPPVKGAEGIDRGGHSLRLRKHRTDREGAR